MFSVLAEEASSGWFLEHLYIVPLIPAAMFFVIMLVGRRFPLKGAELAILSMVSSLVLSVGAAYQWVQRVDSVGEAEGEAAGRWLGGLGRALVASEGGHSEPFVQPVITRFSWWEIGPFDFTWGSQADGLSVMLLFVVSLITTLVMIYSIEYMRGDRRYTSFFAALALFAAGMLCMVSAESMVQFILGWEIMGLCSFLLIGHWWEEDYNSRSALKAFYTVRVGDIGLLVGTSIIFFSANGFTQENFGVSGFSIEGIQAWALSGTASSTAITLGAVALFCAAIGKSGQFPLHTWLPDAMAGPTPVSSLLHSSTMVVAGVFLVARLYPVFWEGMGITDGAVNFITVIAAITIVIAAALAFVQDDIKKVLAYSTISQLGYMMLGLGAGAWLPAVFHIFTHAYFKAGLFLGAGSVSHSGSHHSFDMRKDMGGLAKKMPITATCWIICSLALAGIFPLAGFFSKDEIIDNVGHNGYGVFMIVALVGAFMTAAYMTRATYLTFFGEPRGAAAGGGAHEAPHDEADMAPALVGAHSSHAEGGDAHEDLAHDDVAHDAGAHGHGADDHGHDGHGHDGHGEHHGPRESGPLILVPVVILSFLAIVAGLTNAVPFGERWERFKTYVEPSSVAVVETEFVAGGPGEGLRAVVPSEDEAEGEAAAEGCGYAPPEEGYCFFPEISHAEFEWSKAFISLALAVGGIIVGWFASVALYTKRSGALVGLTERVAPLGVGYRFLRRKYYLDDAWDGVAHATAHPIARVAYWINQHVIDAVVNTAGRVTRDVGRWVYRNVDQRVVDGTVNGIGAVAEESGDVLRPTQSGKVSQYGALLFSAAAVGALVLVLLNT
jgi:NADH-quinone oxidoreductase subunit L